MINLEIHPGQGGNVKIENSLNHQKNIGITAQKPGEKEKIIANLHLDPGDGTTKVQVNDEFFKTDDLLKQATALSEDTNLQNIVIDKDNAFINTKNPDLQKLIHLVNILSRRSDFRDKDVDTLAENLYLHRYGHEDKNLFEKLTTEWNKGSKEIFLYEKGLSTEFPELKNIKPEFVDSMDIDTLSKILEEYIYHFPTISGGITILEPEVEVLYKAWDRVLEEKKPQSDIVQTILKKAIEANLPVFYKDLVYDLLQEQKNGSHETKLLKAVRSMTNEDFEKLFESAKNNDDITSSIEYVIHARNGLNSEKSKLLTN